MSAYVTDGRDHRTGYTAESSPAKPLTLVVGYDGSEPAQHALDRAISALHRRDGSMQVVFVTHVPGTAAMSGQALVEVRDGLDQQATNLAHSVAELLEGSGIRWQFQRREGSVADELMAVAGEQTRSQGPDSDVVIVVGGPSHWYHHVAGSVSSVIARRDRFALLVEP